MSAAKNKKKAMEPRISCRTDKAFKDRINTAVTFLKKKNAGLRISEADLVRMAVEKYLPEVETEAQREKQKEAA